MSNNPTTHRDAGSGKYVNEEFADANPKTTVSEKVDGMDRLAVGAVSRVGFREPPVRSAQAV